MTILCNVRGLEIQAYDLIGKDAPIPISNDTVLERLISGSYPTEELKDDGRVLNESIGPIRLVVN